jgi:hypothetical protein
MLYNVPSYLISLFECGSPGIEPHEIRLILLPMYGTDMVEWKDQLRHGGAGQAAQ